MPTGNSENNTAAEPVFRDTATTYHTEQGTARRSNRDCVSYKLMSGLMRVRTGTRCVKFQFCPLCSGSFFA